MKNKEQKIKLTPRLKFLRQQIQEIQSKIAARPIPDWLPVLKRLEKEALKEYHELYSIEERKVKQLTKEQNT